jgi:hypothetical protein
MLKSSGDNVIVTGAASPGERSESGDAAERRPRRAVAVGRRKGVGNEWHLNFCKLFGVN